MGRLRRRIVAALAVGCLAGAAGAAHTPPPRIPVGVPFKVAQERLARAGIVPARIVRLGEFCGGEEMACEPLPHIVCGNWYDYCRYLFVRRSDNAFFFVGTRIVVFRDGSHEVGGFYEIVPASQKDLRDEDLEVILPNGQQRRFSNPPLKAPRTPPRPEPPAPLCSEAPPHTLPCWVKPPAGYRKPR